MSRWETIIFFGLVATAVCTDFTADSDAFLVRIVRAASWLSATILFFYVIFRHGMHSAQHMPQWYAALGAQQIYPLVRSTQDDDFQTLVKGAVITALFFSYAGWLGFGGRALPFDFFASIGTWAMGDPLAKVVRRRTSMEAATEP